MKALLPTLAMRRPLDRLIDRGLIIQGGFSPSGCRPCAGQAVDLVAGGRAAWGPSFWPVAASKTGVCPELSAEALATLTLERVVLRSGEVLMEALLAEEDELALEAIKGPARRLVARALQAATEKKAGLISPALALNLPLAAVGAPAETYYPILAERLGGRLVVPPHAEVCNAVGAVAGGVLQRVKLLITSPSEGLYRLHLPDGIKDFSTLAEAKALAVTASQEAVRKRALDAGAGDPDIEIEETEKVAEVVGGKPIFVEAEVIATAAGRPRLS